MSRSISQISVLDGFQGCTIMDSIKNVLFFLIHTFLMTHVGADFLVCKLHVFSSFYYLSVISLESAFVAIMWVHNPWTNSLPGKGSRLPAVPSITPQEANPFIFSNP